VLHAEPLVALANWVYVFGHWPVLIAVLAWLALRHPLRFAELRGALLLSGAVGFTNQYAAVPSLHVGWDLLAGIAIVTTARRRWVRVLGGLLPVLMVLAVVVTANHFVLDAVAGAVLAVASLAVVRHRTRRRAVRTAGPALPAAAVVVARQRPAEERVEQPSAA
jgi:hypothetical protein